MTVPLPVGLLSGALVVLVGSRGVAEDAESLRLVPFPKQVNMAPGRFALDRLLQIEAPQAAKTAVETFLLDELKRAGAPAPGVRYGQGPQLFVRWSARPESALPQVNFRPEATDEDYVLSVDPQSVLVAAPAMPGLLHGLTTLGQLVRANRREGAIPCLVIRDWPSLRWRAFQDDLTRGPSTKLSELKRDATRGAMLKLNIFTYYMQHQFAFTRHPLIGPEDGSLAPAELAALVEHARPLGVHVLGNQQSFAHMQHVLAHSEYAHLKEDDRTLSPAHEGTYRLLDDLYSDVLPILPFEMFNVCCDETWGLGTKGPSKPLADQIGPGGVYVGHIRRVYDLVHGKYGKRMMIWGDIILKHPDKLDQVPEDVIMLTWNYNARESFEDQIVPFARSGYEFFVCPGVNNWRRVLPDFSRSVTNIGNFVRDGHKHGALGMLNTSWDDDGENLNAPNWYGFAWGAECAWNAAQTPLGDFNRRVGAVLFGEPEEHFGQAIQLLCDPRFAGMTNRTFWEAANGPVRMESPEPAEDCLKVVRAALGHLEACRESAAADADLLDPVEFGARRIEQFYQGQIDRLDAASARQQAIQASDDERARLLDRAAASLRRSRDAYRDLRDRWRTLWLRENKPYALDWSLARYDQTIAQFDELLAQP